MIIFFETDVIVFAKELRSKKEKIENAELSNIKTSLSIVTQHYNLITITSIN